MEYVEGNDLAQLVKKQGPLPEAQAMACILQAACGLAHAHAAGIVHRDIKPHNLLLASGGQITASRERQRPEGRRTGGELSQTQALGQSDTEPTPRRHESGKRWLLVIGAPLVFAGIAIVGLIVGNSGPPKTKTAAKPTGPTTNTTKPTGPGKDVDDAWIKMVQALPPEEQVNAVAAKLIELNPGFDGKLTPTISKGAVKELTLSTLFITDISPVRVLDRLEKLSCFGQTSAGPYSRFVDLMPLAGMKLKELNLGYNQNLQDLSPLKDVPLENLHLWGTGVADLTPLARMPLRGIGLNAGWERRMADERYGGVLRSLRSLEKINDKPAAEFWKQVDGK